MQQSSHNRDQLSRASRAERERPTTHTAPRRSQQIKAAPRRTAQHTISQTSSADQTPSDRPARAHHHRPQALPAEPHRAAPGKPAAEQSSAASRQAIRSWVRGATHEREGYPRTRSPRHGHHSHLPFAANGLGRTLSLREEGVPRARAVRWTRGGRSMAPKNVS